MPYWSKCYIIVKIRNLVRVYVLNIKPNHQKHLSKLYYCIALYSFVKKKKSHQTLKKQTNTLSSNKAEHKLNHDLKKIDLYAKI